MEAVKSVAARKVTPAFKAEPVKNIDFAVDVFTRETMLQYLSKDTSKKLLATIEQGQPLDPSIAGEVAHAIRHWAMDRGATHYTHWFLPLNGSTAEKHDSFLEVKNGEPIMSFSAKNLIVGEPDASSFPSGGIRSTFEARGYTAWDPTSPAFIKRHGNGATLCIPTAFCAYTGEALDKKTPLLRSIQALSTATRRLMKCFGKNEEKVDVTLGAEQEYFLIDKNFYLLRPDLIMTGRTLFGAPPPKHQQLEDHYFGTIKMRVLNFMNDVERELWSLGIPAKTRHNEVAPCQFELAPIFEEVNLSCDHNMLVMEVLRQTADRHGFVCLLHEKPFAGVNGSGKHNNWSVSYSGVNLLNPGSDPHQNAIFLTVLCSIIEAVDKHADLLRSVSAGAGNDHRLGAHEAPPAIFSVYLGDQLADVVAQLEKGEPTHSKHAGVMRIGVDTLPPLPKDATDRNRTSPFAFTSNKFEFRALGSSMSCAGTNIVLNTIVAEAFDRMASVLETSTPETFHETLQQLLSQTVRDHKRVLFNGDGYAEAWVEEAKKRGLPNLKTTPEALKALTAKKNIDLFCKYGVFTERELESRYEIHLDDYHQKVMIEAACAVDIASTMIAPAVRAECAKAFALLKDAKSAGIEAGLKTLEVESKKIGENLDSLFVAIENVRSALRENNVTLILPLMEKLREIVDDCENIVDDQSWPLPKYREMMFIY
jgi:glutamine synthetase